MHKYMTIVLASSRGFKLIRADAVTKIAAPFPRNFVHKFLRGNLTDYSVLTCKP